MITPGLRTATGVFVTLNTAQGDLRGCIGHIRTERPLYETVVDVAQSSAFHDTRFEPLTKEELAGIVIELSLLTPPEKITTLHEIKLGKHGIILKKFAKDGSLEASAVFLPAVPIQQKWNLRTTLEQLSIKAGLGRDGWKRDVEFQLFEDIKIRENKEGAADAHTNSSPEMYFSS
jgi:AmmeMemoRadiSam system protein A